MRLNAHLYFRVVFERVCGLGDLRLANDRALHICEFILFFSLYCTLAELTKYLFAKTGAQFILSERFNQDPLNFGKL